ncbi:MAG: nitrous oxide reductase accessory protein NosL [Phycisphaerae bacterium]|nr:nitrous oxide reductase accessory protein NosL [Phycisphaerae bacterium]
MNPRARSNFALFASLMGVGALASCQQTPLTGPPELKLGHQECGDCGMLINEDRCCAAILVDIDGTHREHMLFDDIGCLLELKAEKSDLKVIEHWVRDYSARTWLKADSAAYLMSERIRTPMGSWIVAFASRQAAEAVQKDHEGRILTWDEVIVARQEWMAARYGKRPG